jgi:hypothetical protein
LPPLASKLGLVGDVSASGTLPTIVTVDNDWFHLSDNVYVLPTDDVEQAWAAVVPGTLLLDAQVAGANNAEQIRSRRMTPIPHEHVAALLQLQAAGTLSWQTLWTTVVQAIIHDPAQSAAYHHFTDFVRVASTQRPANAGAANDRAPEVERDINVLIATPAMREQARCLVLRFLPGLATSQGLGAQLNQVQQQIQQNQLAIAAQAVPAPVTLESKYPSLFQTVVRICETPNEPEFAVYWQDHPKLKAGAVLATLEGHCNLVARNSNLTAPILSPAFCSDVSLGRVTCGPNPNDITEGLSPFRIRTTLSPKREELNRRNRTYTAMQSGAGRGEMDAVNLVLANNEVEPPQTGSEFRAYLEGLHVVDVVVLGTHNRMVQNYRRDIINRMSALTQRIESLYDTEAGRRYAYLLVLVYLHRVRDGYLQALLGAADLTAARQVTPPDFGVIAEHIQLGRLTMITEIPPGLLRQAGPLPAGGATGVAPREGGEGNRLTVPSGGGAERLAVYLPNQNRNLRDAWTATGHTSIFRGENAPFRDPTARDGKKVVLSDTPNPHGPGKQRICIPMACTGRCYSNCTGKHTVLSTAEVGRVAAAGGFNVA